MYKFKKIYTLKICVYFFSHLLVKSTLTMIVSLRKIEISLV